MESSIESTSPKGNNINNNIRGEEGQATANSQQQQESPRQWPTTSSGAPMDDTYFYDPSHFPHMNILARNYLVILRELTQALYSPILHHGRKGDAGNSGAELSGVWCEDDAFNDFYNQTKDEEGWLHWWSVNNPHKPNDEWTIFGLMHGGKYMTENCKKCPETTRLLEQVPGLRVAGFSRLQPKSGIDTHKGFTGRRYGALAYHLGLLIPPCGGATLHCGPHVHKWTKGGDVIVFDDTWAHSAWNKSDQERIILYIDFKIPDVLLSKWGQPSNMSDSSDDEDDSYEEEHKSDVVKPLILPARGPERDELLKNLNGVQLLQLLMRGTLMAKERQIERESKQAKEKEEQQALARPEQTPTTETATATQAPPDNASTPP